MRYRRVTSGLRLLALELLVCAQCLIGQDLLMAHEAIPRTDENSRAAHQQLLAKARQGTIDVYFIGELMFQRDNMGQLTGFTASNGRTKGIHFEKQE